MFRVHEDPHDMFKPNPQTPPKLPVYNIEPLLRASQSLFGTVSHRRFPLMAGAHVPCAIKEAYSLDPNTNKPTSGWLWSFLSFVIAENRDTDACSIVEDAGFLADSNSMNVNISEREVRDELESKLKNVIYCQDLARRNMCSPYKEIFAGYKCQYIPPGSVGCALTCAPYVLLAKGVYPNKDAKTLASMNLASWEEAMPPPPSVIKTL